MQRYLTGGIVLAAMIVGLTSPVRGQVVINEVLQNPEGNFDEFYEYIELYGRPGMDLTGYAIAAIKGGRDVNNDGVFDSSADVPEIDEAFSLDGLTLGPNGFLVIYNDTGGFSDLTIDPNSHSVSFTAAHIPSTDTPGKLDNDGSSTFILVRKRFDHSINGIGQSVYGSNYAFRKDVRHDVNADGDVDFGTELNTIGTPDTALRVEPYQMVDDFAWSHEHGREYHRDPQNEISDSPGFNPDMLSRLRYYIANPQRGYRTIGDAVGPFTIEPTTILDESFVYGEMVTVAPGPNFFAYATTLDPVSGYIRTKAPTDSAATPFSGSCDPEPDDVTNPSCTAVASGAYQFTDINISGLKLTPGTFNDHPTNVNLKQFRFIHGDFNCDGVINEIDRRLIEDRVGKTLDDVEAAIYDPTPQTPASGDEVNYNRYLQQGAEFELVLMMREMDLDDGPGGTNAAAVTTDDVNAFLAVCSTCGNGATPPAVRITEYMYAGNGGEFVEFTNLSGSPVDMTGWSYSDSARLAGQVDLSAFGMVSAGQSVILTEDDRAQFAVRWHLSGVKIVGLLSVGLSRNDEINLYNAAGVLADRLTFGDQTFPGTIRTQNFSGWPCSTAVGNNTIASWTYSLIGGDAQNSFFSTTGDVGNPGSFVLNNCSTTLPTGACCTAGLCADGPTSTQAFCQQTGGLYQGNASTCASVSCPQPSNAAVRITEYMYGGPGGEFFEVTNLDAAAVNMSGWSFDDAARVQGTFSLSSLGTLQPGESALVTESAAAAFRTQWGLAGTVKVVGNLGNPVGNHLGRNDEINIYDASGTLVDRLTYGDEDFPGTIMAENVSGWACSTAIGLNNIANWQLSQVGDAQTSISAGGAIGNPGHFVSDPCAGGQPTGACCYIDGHCTDTLTQAACENGSGTWHGANSTCATANCPAPSDVKMRITEYMYDGVGKEFVEFTNIGPTPIDMTGWSYDDDSQLPGTVVLSLFGTVAPNESVILCEDVAATFRTNWGLSAGVKIIGGSSANLGRNDEINLFDANGQTVDRLTFGDQNFPGTIRTQNKSGWTCHQKLGNNDIHDWRLSVVADQQNSITSAGGDVGSPGSYVNVPCSLCATCPGDGNGNGTIDVSDITPFVNCALSILPIGSCRCSDMDENGVVDGRDVQAYTIALITNPGACP